VLPIWYPCRTVSSVIQAQDRLGRLQDKAMKQIFALFLSCKSVSKYPIDEVSLNNLDDRIIGKWKFEEDTNKNNFYEVIPRKEPYKTDRYHVKFWDRGGKNPTYEANIHFSKIGNVTFINVPYWEGNFTHKGYFFLRILETNADFTRMTTTTVYDTTLWELTSQAAVRERITRNLNNPSYYYDTVHFYKEGGTPAFVPVIKEK
jgi:hypothetical protein